MLRRIATVVGMTLLLAGPAAALSEWGTRASGYTRSCPGGLCSGTFLEQLEDAAPLEGFASVALSDAVQAANPGVDFAAEAELAGALALPVLRAIASSDTAQRYDTTASAEAVQGYQYQGASPFDFVLDVSVDGSVTGNGLLSAFVAVYDASLADPLEQPLGALLASTSFLLDATRRIEASALAFSLEPGDEIYVSASLFAGADSRFSTPSIADGFGTLELAFQDSQGLVQAAAIPEASTGALVLVGLALLAPWRRASAA